MQNEITISELAKLMNVSVHQIRYFEEKGVLQPAYTDENQYRMYGIEEVYKLSHILLLRKLGVSVQTIKECMTSYSADQYRDLFHTSLQEIEAELRRLKETQHFIKKVLQEQQDATTKSKQFQIKWRDTTYFTTWIKMDVSEQLTARHLAAQANRIPNLFEMDFHCIYDGSNTISLSLETKEPADHSLPQGNYLSMQTLINADDELEQAIEQLYAYAASQSFVTSGPLLLTEKSYLSLFSEQKLHYELQVCIEQRKVEV
ncbi:MerR family transcriptional regulator [Paenibacillus agilis]|uniref:MerR family transcriptional regulator n=1 Tax=Paenibacillus agilis TaxID=3020863 RepID=A0A559J0I3_9BACL|nr:MerR family transcriptional regulator [Paenibacillus agilis]TVX93394.1 MerR family transcriptional regulator [Paenibacillus agilis]